MRAASAALFGAIVLAIFASSAAADEQGSGQDEAQEAVESGAVIPLAEVLARPEIRQAGEVVDVRLLHDGKRWIYQLRCVDPAGKLVDLTIDARESRSGGRAEGY